MPRAPASPQNPDTASGWRLGLCGLLLALLSSVSLAANEPYLYGPIRTGEQLVRIAEALRPDATPESTWQMMAALYRANPRAFVNGDIHHLRPGAMLVVPVDAEVRAVSVEQARQLALAPRKPHSAAPAQSGRLELSEKSTETAPAASSPRPAAAAPPAVGTQPSRTVAQKPARKPAPATPRPAEPAESPVPAVPSEPAPTPAVVAAAEFLPPPAQDEVALPVPDRWRLQDSLMASNTGPMSTSPASPQRLRALPLQASVRLLADSALQLRRAPQRERPTDVALEERGQTSLHAQLMADVQAQPSTAPASGLRIRLTPVLHLSHRNPARDGRAGFQSEQDVFLGLQTLYADVAPAALGRSARLRAGIQPVLSDARGLIMADEPFGLSLYGDADRLGVYHVGWLRRFEKDPESGLNALNESLREDDVLLLQLRPRPGFHSNFPVQLLIAHHRNREGNDRFSRDGQQERPSPLGLQQGRNLDVTYVGGSGEGSMAGAELYAAGYLALGEEDRGTFVDRSRDVIAGMLATEARWQRGEKAWRLSALWASGDGDPTDGSANGFDAIAAHPRFAGAEDSGWARAALDLPGRDVELHGDHGWLPSLRSSRAHGQSNFANPGLMLLGVGGEHWLQHSLRISGALNHLWYEDTRSLELASGLSRIPRDIGWDVSATVLWRPQPRLALRVTGTTLIPANGHEALFSGEDALHGIFASATAQF